MASDDDIIISFFDKGIPDHIEGDMERLYQNPYSTLAHHRAYGDLSLDTSVYVARKNGVPVAVLLLRRDKDMVRVLNEQIRLDAEEVRRFAQYIFTTLEDINVIVLHAIDTEMQRIPFPAQHFNCTEDIVLALPLSLQEYRARLGKSTRSYISRYLNKLRRDFPSLRHEVYLKGDVGEHHLRQIVEMNRVRMAGKNRKSYIDDKETARIIDLAKRFGLVSILTIDGRVCAGAINYRIGDNYFLKVIAHDSAYNDYRLGTLCCYLAIGECIVQGGKEYHFLWGRYEYKYRLLGIQHDLDHVVVYRSRLQMALKGRMVLRNLAERHALRARSWLLSRMQRDDGLGAALHMTWHLLRDLRHARSLSSLLAAFRNSAVSRRAARNNG